MLNFEGFPRNGGIIITPLDQGGDVCHYWQNNKKIMELFDDKSS